MVVAVPAVRVVQVPIDEVVDVVAVRDRLVTATGTVDVFGRVPGARAVAAALRVRGIHRDHVLVDVIAVRVVQVPVVDEVDVALVDHGQMAAAGAVDVTVLGGVGTGAGHRRGTVIGRAAGCAARRGQRPGGWRTLNPRFDRVSACQRVPARFWPDVSKRSPATDM